jgi:hypothetical protein
MTKRIITYHDLDDDNLPSIEEVMQDFEPKIGDALLNLGFVVMGDGTSDDGYKFAGNQLADEVTVMRLTEEVEGVSGEYQYVVVLQLRGGGSLQCLTTPTLLLKAAQAAVEADDEANYKFCMEEWKRNKKRKK